MDFKGTTLQSQEFSDKQQKPKTKTETKIKTKTKTHIGGRPSILAKRIFDKDSGRKLYQRNFKTGESVFLAYAQVLELPKNPNTYISCDKVMEIIKQTILKEMVDAKRVLARLRMQQLEDSTILSSLWEEQRAEYAKQAEVIFEKMKQAEQGRIPLAAAFSEGKICEEEYQKEKEQIRQKLRDYDREFQALTQAESEQECMYSEKNPWLIAFAKRELPEELKLEDIKRWVEKVEIQDFREVFVILTQREGREVFPKEWLDEGIEATEIGRKEKGRKQ
ncbi:MAG: hypothetical protein Q4D90_10605 [bacterium]|nr:hypothetical protein [bacterium]